MNGELLGIFLANTKSAEMAAFTVAQAHAHRGLEGDRYFLHDGTFSKNSTKSRDVTLIEVETVVALKRDYNIDVLPKDLRRNLLTKNIALNHFVGKTLILGDVVVEGIELCEPCGYLSDMLKQPLKEALKHRGGLRARILKSGVLTVGMEISAKINVI